MKMNMFYLLLYKAVYQYSSYYTHRLILIHGSHFGHHLGFLGPHQCRPQDPGGLLTTGYDKHFGIEYCL